MACLFGENERMRKAYGEHKPLGDERREILRRFDKKKKRRSSQKQVKRILGRFKIRKSLYKQLAMYKLKYESEANWNLRATHTHTH